MNGEDLNISLLEKTGDSSLLLGGKTDICWTYCTPACEVLKLPLWARIAQRKTPSFALPSLQWGPFDPSQAVNKAACVQWGRTAPRWDMCSWNQPQREWLGLQLIKGTPAGNPDNLKILWPFLLTPVLGLCSVFLSVWWQKMLSKRLLRFLKVCSNL